MTVIRFSQLKVTVLLFSSFSLLPFFAQAGGILLGGTRIIYPQESQRESVSVRNSDSKTSFLVKSWIENADGQMSKDFVVTPPLYTSAPGNENMLRVVRTGSAFPSDRETLYYFNTKGIPAVDKKTLEGKSALILAVVTRVKMFVRPAGLKPLPETAPAELRFHLKGQEISIYNPTPYYLTLTDVKIGKTPLANPMIAPFSESVVALPSTAVGQITFSTINDYGGVTPIQKGVMQ